MPRSEMFSSAPATTVSSSLSIIGLTILLDRPVDCERPCCSNLVVITIGTPPHKAGLRCSACGRHRGWLSEATIAFITETKVRFGAPSIITLKRNPSTAAGAGDEDQ